MIKKIRRNEIYFADLGETIGSEEKGTRPVLIVQNNLGNKHSTTTIVLPITRRIEEKCKVPTHIVIEPFGKMIYKATILAEQIKVLDKKRIKHFIDKLPDKYIEPLNNAMRIAIDLQENNIGKK